MYYLKQLLILRYFLYIFNYINSKKWHKYLHWAEYCYNVTFHSSLGMTPFKAAFGRDPASILDYIPATASTEVVDQMLIKRQELIQKLKRNFLKAQKNMKKIADGRRRHLELQIGDLVLVKLQPYRQKSIATRVSNKLSARYFGPFKVIKRIGSVAYQLELPLTA